MRADRLLSVLLLLQAHGRLTARQLAGRLEVSMRTVQRDMEALSAAGVPVFALRGAAGGWQLTEGWRTQVPALDPLELKALLMAQLRVLGDERLARAAAGALDKLIAALPASLQGEAASMRQRLYVDPRGWYGVPEKPAMLPLVQDAVARDRKLVMSYLRAGRERVERTVDPLGLVAKGEVWYLVAGTPAGLRTYRVSRIERATLLDQPSRRPPAFDLAGYWEASVEALLRERSRYEAVLRLAPGAAASLARWRQVVPVEDGAGAGPPGWVTVRSGFEDEEQARFIVLGYGPRVDVLAPAGLRDAVAADLEAAWSRLGPKS
jgi:predicted DNA-binding transcriptional regulator YafY